MENFYLVGSKTIPNYYYIAPGPKNRRPKILNLKIDHRLLISGLLLQQGFLNSMWMLLLLRAYRSLGSELLFIITGGEVVAASSKRVKGGFSASIAEVLAIREGLNFVVERGSMIESVESDAQAVVKLLSSQENFILKVR